MCVALKHTAGPYILNGNWTNSWPGDYEGAGTVFRYRKENGGNSGEAVFASGPLSESVDLIVSKFADGLRVNFVYAAYS